MAKAAKRGLGRAKEAETLQPDAPATKRQLRRIVELVRLMAEYPSGRAQQPQQQLLMMQQQATTPRQLVQEVAPATNEYFARLENSEYNLEIMAGMTAETAVARKYNLASASEVIEAIEHWKAAKVKTTKRGTAKAKPRTKKANPQLTVARLKAAYEVLVRESDLANPKLSEAERLRQSVNLRNTYDRLHKLNPSFHDDSEQLRLARQLLNSRAYARRKGAEAALVNI